MLAENEIYNMDCLVGLTKIADESVDMIFVDLPYGTTKNSWDVVISPDALWPEYERVIKPHGAILLFGQNKFTAKMMLSNQKLHRYNIIWEKTTPTGFLNANRMPLRTHEDIMVFYKKNPVYHAQKTAGHCRKVSSAKHKRNSDKSSNYGDYGLTTYDSTERFPTSIWTFATDKQKSALHPTQKPLELCRYAIRTYSNPGDLVVDHCCGAGTIPLAAKMEGRRFIGMDNGVCEKKRSPLYGMPWAEIAKKRINGAKLDFFDAPSEKGDA